MKTVLDRFFFNLLLGEYVAFLGGLTTWEIFFCLIFKLSNLFVNATICNYNISSKNWHWDESPNCETKWLFLVNGLISEWLLLGCIEDTCIVSFTLLKIRKL